MSWEIREGDALRCLREMEPESVQTCVTSPPYWGLRDYGSEGQLGLESAPEEYVANLVAVFREVRRVLRDDGTLWLNLGDSYAASVSAGTKTFGNPEFNKNRPSREATKTAARVLPTGLKSKDLVGIPWMVAFALRADGWYLRSDIIWAKPNPMPESVTDRPTKAHEYLFLLSKSPRYYYDADAIREESAPSSMARAGIPRKVASKDSIRADTISTNGQSRLMPGQVIGEYGGDRNKRSVWTVATQPFPGAHFATFPPKLIEPCILAGTPPKCCGECGTPWQRQEAECVVRSTVGWDPECHCLDPDERFDRVGTGRSTVLDPFAGAGTTGVVALRHDRSFIGIELSPEYAEMARNRIVDDAPLLNAQAAA